MKHLNSKVISVWELAITAVVLGTVAAMAAPKFEGVLKKLRFKDRSSAAFPDMRPAKFEAIAKRTQFGLYFDYNENDYVLFKDLVDPRQFTYDYGDSVIKKVSLGQDVWIYNHTFP
jgi:hypothetical protein